MLKLAKIREFPKVQVWILSRCALEMCQRIHYLWGYIVISFCQQLVDIQDGWLRLSRMKDCFMGLRFGGSFLTFCSAIVSSSTSNSSSSYSTLSLGISRMVRSIFVSSGRMVGFLDRSPCMNWTKFGNYNSFSTAV